MASTLLYLVRHGEHQHASGDGAVARLAVAADIDRCELALAVASGAWLFGVVAHSPK